MTSKKQNKINNSFIVSRFSDAILRRIFETTIPNCKKTAKKLQTLCGYPFSLVSGIFVKKITMSKVTSFPVVKIKPKGIGALPVGLKGKLYGQPFKVVIQYDAFGGVRAQIIEDEPGGGMITEVSGRAGEVAAKAGAFSDWAFNRYRKDQGESYNNASDYARKSRENDKRDISKRSESFVKNLFQEVKDFNAGKDTKTKKAAPVTIAPKKAPAAKKPAAARTVTKTVPVKAYCVKSHKRTIKVPAKK